ncbi:hypothetical protein [Planobispora rosea]|nr:hypothetical protein [Planobispora rosea]
MEVRQIPVPLTEHDQEFLRAVRDPGSPEYMAVHRLVGGAPKLEKSFAVALHALMSIARKAVREEVMLAGYAMLAATQNGKDHAAHRAAWHRAAEVAGRE